MKIRQDYVSNSSSSSFVLANMELFNHFDITKDDILNALVDAYGVEAYKNAKTRIMKSVKEHPDWYKDDLKWNKFGPFWVYDLSIPEEKKEATARWGRLLKSWNATNCMHAIQRNGKKIVVLDSCAAQDYDEAMESIAKVYDISRFSLDDVAAGGTAKRCCRFIRTEDKDPKTGLYGYYEPISSELVSVVRDIRKVSGVMNNLEAVKSKCARFFVHADDNELCTGLMCEMGKTETVWDMDAKDFVPANGTWETESCTYDRVCEVVLKYLVKTGKVKLDEPSFLEKMKVDEKYLSDKDKEEGRIYDFYNNRRFSWQDVKHQSMTWRMHEG